MELLLVSGVGGSGVSSVARGLARGFRDAGLSTAEVNSAVSAPIESSSLWSDAVDTFGVWLQGLGAASMAADELVGLAGLNELITGGLVADAVANPNIDVVIWDMGSTREALRILQLLDTVPMLLDRLLTGPAAAQLSAPEPAALIAAWYRLVNHVVAARDDIRAATCVLVGETRDVPELVSVAGVLRLYDCVTSAVVLNKVKETHLATSKKQSKSSRQSGQEAALIDQEFGVPVVRLPFRDTRGPKVSKTAVRLRPLCKLLKDLPRNSGPVWSVSAVKKDYTFTFPLYRGADIRVGRRGDSLLLVCDGQRRQLELPAVLKRCLITGGGMNGASLVLRFAPDPKVWRDSRE
ncbi:MAG: hypothetical protein F2806_06075 [Actinobacteria bacterium]|uniref:Unannotated protein n=1 Tax=freshwater metagenome TaxID=449393 RepID=A0A6J7GEI1_9ZZZZ|nr:hypothetical protein [Actinomycetota bacterium]